MPFAAIYLPPAPPPAPAVAAAERAILDAEGLFTVAGLYYASEADAAIARRREAERRVRAATRPTSSAAPAAPATPATPGRAS